MEPEVYQSRALNEARAMRYTSSPQFAVPAGGNKMRTLICLLALAASASTAQAQTWPAKPIRMIVSFPAGGPSDLLGRALIQKLTEQLGQNIVADNRVGAGGNLGISLAAKAPPDGYN